MVQIEALVFRYRGDRATERARTETAMALARESRSSFGIARTLVIAAFGAWFAGEDDDFTRYARELEAALTPTTARGMEVFCASARGDLRAVFRSEGFEPAKLRCYAALVACGQAEGADRADLARAALKAAEAAAEPANVTIACIACAESIGSQASTFIDRARTAAATVDSAELQAAVEAYASASHDLGLLAPLVRRLRAVRPRSPRSVPVSCHISLARARVERDGKVQRLTSRELQLVLCLAVRRRACRAEELLEVLWQRAERPDASVLRVYVRRTRLKLGENAIVTVAGGYALGNDVRVDLEEIEAAIAQARQQQPIAPAVRTTLAAYLQAMRERQPTVAETWDWFAPVGARIEDLTRGLAMMLGRDALGQQAYEAALAYSQGIIERDACDEPARELRIRAHLGAGDRAAAMRELRVYRNTLASELEAVPSASLIALVGNESSHL
jgi:DNA-binding SARP family transcriptional activator